MVKRDKISKILFPIVALIWVGVLYRFFLSGNETKKPEKIMENITTQVSSLDTSNFSFKIRSDFKDPFLKEIKMKAEVSSVSNATQTLAQTKLIKEQEKEIPVDKDYSFSYLGSIKADSSNIWTGLLKYDNQIFRVREGDSVENFSVSRVFPDSLILKGGNKFKVIER